MIKAFNPKKTYIDIDRSELETIYEIEKMTQADCLKRYGKGSIRIHPTLEKEYVYYPVRYKGMDAVQAVLDAKGVDVDDNDSDDDGWRLYQSAEISLEEVQLITGSEAEQQDWAEHTVGVINVYRRAIADDNNEKYDSVERSLYENDYEYAKSSQTFEKELLAIQKGLITAIQKHNGRLAGKFPNAPEKAIAKRIAQDRTKAFAQWYRNVNRR